MIQTDKTDIFEKIPVPRAVMTMAIPTIIGQLIVLFYNMADTFFVGQTNNPAMVAGASLILPVFNVSIALAGFTGVGGGALVSRLLGQNQWQEAKKVSSFSARLSILIAALFSLLTFFFMDFLLGFLGAGEATWQYAKAYAFCVIVLGAVPTVVSGTLSNLLRSVGESKKAGIGITMGGLINVALDPLFMFVLLPEGNEIVGAGIATFLSNCIACIYFWIVIRRMGRESVLAGCAFIKTGNTLPSKESFRGIFAVGIPAAVATLLFDLDYMVIGRLMSAYGEIQMAAIGIVLKVERLPLNIGIGICQGMMPLVAYNYSAGNHKRMKQTVSFSRNLGIGCAAVSVLLYELFSPFIMRIFIGDGATVALGTQFLRIRCLATPFMFLSFFIVHLFNGFGEGENALLLGIVRWLVLNIPMLYLLNYLVGMYGIVWTQVTADVINVIFSFWIYGRWIKRNLPKGGQHV